MSQPNTTPQGIWNKLFQIQKKVRTFCPTIDSDKEDPKTGKSAYRYTPGWKIVESVREEMDTLGLMLVPDIRFEKAETIEYPVYKLINGSPMSFIKKEIHFIVSAAFTWIDPGTGESVGPFNIVASGANGTDKSCASALALAERYFLLKFFHFTTRDLDDEPDAHDSDTVPGIPRDVQKSVTNGQACRATAAPAAPYGGFPGGYSAPTPAMAGRPVQGAPAPATQQVNVFAAAPQYGQQGPVPTAQPFNENNPFIRQAIDKLANFDRGTLSHTQVLNECVGVLSANGILCTDESFIRNLTEAGQARRENRTARYV